MNRQAPKALLTTFLAAVLLATGCTSSSDGSESASDATATEVAADSTDAGSNVAASNAAASNETVPAADPSEDVDWASLSDETITLSNEQMTISQGGSYTLTGESNASVVVNTQEDVRLILDGVNIVSETGAAIVIEDADNVYVTLADGSDNYLEDASTRSDAEINGTLYSTADLAIAGSGSLTVKANYQDGIVTKDDLVITSGTIIIEAVDEGIRGRDSVTISGGAISIVAGGDGMKTTNSEEADRGYVYISGGSVTIDAGDDAIKAATFMTIDAGTINILDSYEGLEAINITINGGDITLYASDDGINAVAGDIAAEVFIAVNGGNIDVTVGSGDTDAFDSNGSIIITDGNINVTAPTSSFDYDDTAEMTGGTITVNGEQLSEIPAGHMGGGGGRGERPAGG